MARNLEFGTRDGVPFVKAKSVLLCLNGDWNSELASKQLSSYRNSDTKPLILHDRTFSKPCLNVAAACHSWQEVEDLCGRCRKSKLKTQDSCSTEASATAPKALR